MAFPLSFLEPTPGARRPARPSGSMLLMFSTVMRLLTSLLMLWATPGYCKEGRGVTWGGSRTGCPCPLASQLR